MRSQPRPLSVHNTGSTVLPAFGVAQVVGVTPAGVIEVQAPDADGVEILIVGSVPIAAGGYGTATADSWVLAAYDYTDDAYPDAGQLWQAQAASTWLNKYISAYRAREMRVPVQVWNPSDFAEDGRMFVIRESDQA